jgi:hypothetical protein
MAQQYPQLPPMGFGEYDHSPPAMQVTAQQQQQHQLMPMLMPMPFHQDQHHQQQQWPTSSMQMHPNANANIIRSNNRSAATYQVPFQRNNLVNVDPTSGIMLPASTMGFFSSF